jgi:hypothetical protein
MDRTLSGLGFSLGSEEVKRRLMRSNQLLLFLSFSMPPRERRWWLLVATLYPPRGDGYLNF